MKEKEVRKRRRKERRKERKRSFAISNRRDHAEKKMNIEKKNN